MVGVSEQDRTSLAARMLTPEPQAGGRTGQQQPPFPSPDTLPSSHRPSQDGAAPEQTDPSTPLYPRTHQSVLMVQMKNWEPLVLGPALAMDRIPAEVRSEQTPVGPPRCPDLTKLFPMGSFLNIFWLLGHI